MKKTIIVIIIVLVVGFGIYYFMSNNGSSGTPYTSTSVTPTTQLPTTTTPPASVPNTPAASIPSTINVSIKNFSFNPPSITIKAGTKVAWINDDTVSHTVTSDSGNLFDSGALSPGQSFSFTFPDAGSISYHCAIHPMMKGSIIVEK